MNSFLNPYNMKYGSIMNGLHDMQIDDIIRIIFSDSWKQKRITDIISNICLDEKTIIHRQEILNDLMYNRNLYNNLYVTSYELAKCHAEYDNARAHRSKQKIKTDITPTDVSVILKDYGNITLKLINIYRRLDSLFASNPPSSFGLKDFYTKIKNVTHNEGTIRLEKLIDDLSMAAFAFGYYTKLDDKLIPEEIKYIITSGKYEGEKFSFFRKKDKVTGRVEINEKVMEDSRGLVVDSYNRSIVIIEDIFESLFSKIGYLVDDFIFFEFGISLYDMLGERRVFCNFPKIGKETTYKKVLDPYITVKYIKEGYSHPIYGNDVQIDDTQSVLVVGSNNTGKTVFLRTIGICQVFAQVGLFVPADYAMIEIKEKIITIFSGEEKDTDVGGRFEKEVIDIKDCIEKADEKSLVIINEIFQSTFAEDGENALFDILNYFSIIKVKWITVTHLTHILEKRNTFVSKVKVYQTTGEIEKFAIKEI